MAKAVCGIPLSQAERAERRVNCQTYGLPPMTAVLGGA